MMKPTRTLINTIKAVSVCTLLLTEPALAQANKNTSSRKKVTVGEMLKKAKEDSRGGKANLLQKNSISLPEGKLGFQQREQVNLNEVKPPRSTELLKYDNSDQAEYEKTLDLQIKELFKLTQQYRTSNARGELWLRLAELYVEKATLVDSRKQDDYDKKLSAFQEGRSKVKPRLDLKESREYNKKAIQLYEWFLRDYPKDTKISQALFFLGYNYFEIGDTQKGSLYYNRLTKEYPQSPFVGEAHFALGEYYFENEKWADAYKEYSKLIKEPKHRLHAFALYKGAWCLFRTGRTEQGIQYLDFIVKNARGDKSGSSASGRRLNTGRLENEALRDLVTFYADTGNTAKAVDYFRNLNIKDSRPYIERLAYLYADKGNREASKDVFKMLIQQEPNSKKAFEYQYQIVQNYFYTKNSPQFKEELYRWIKDYDTNSTWYANNKSDQTFIQNSEKLREQTLRNYILQQHQTAQNSRAQFSRQSASEGYKLYIQEFSQTPQAADMRFYYGELMYDMGQYEEASNQYSWVAENAPQSKFASKASQNILLSIEKALPKDSELQQRVGDSITPIPMDPRVEKFIRYSNQYLQAYPNSDKDAEIRFRIGRLYYLTNNFAPAEESFKTIVQKHPKSKYSEYSANLLVDIYNLKKDYVGLEKMGTELLANDAISGTKAGSDIRNTLEKANFKKAQDLDAEKKFEEAATQFQLFAVQNPKSELVPAAIYNAAINFERSGRNADAIQNYKKVLTFTDKKSEELKPKVKRFMAKLYQDSGQYEESANLYRQIAKEEPNDKLAPSYIFNAAVMYESLGRTNEAIKAYTEYINVNKNARENAETMFTIAQLQRKAGVKNVAILRYKDYIEMPAASTEKKLEAHYWVWDLGKSLGRFKEPNEAKEEVLNLQKRLSGDKRTAANAFVAKIKYEKAKETYAQMRTITIPADPNKQKKALERKLEVMNQLNTELSDIIKLDSAEEIVNSLYLLGESNLHMGMAIEATPMPSSLTEEQKKLYKIEVDKIAQPFFVKAEDSFKATVERGSDLDVYNEGYKNSLIQMNKRNPKQFVIRKEAIFENRLINWMGDK